jgi:hypothetical protein
MLMYTEVTSDGHAYGQGHAAEGAARHCAAALQQATSLESLVMLGAWPKTRAALARQLAAALGHLRALNDVCFVRGDWQSLSLDSMMASMCGLPALGNV